MTGFLRERSCIRMYSFSEKRDVENWCCTNFVPNETRFMQSYCRQQNNKHVFGSKALNLGAFLFYSIRLFFLQKKCRQVLRLPKFKRDTQAGIRNGYVLVFFFCSSKRKSNRSFAGTCNTSAIRKRVSREMLVFMLGASMLEIWVRLKLVNSAKSSWVRLRSFRYTKYLVQAVCKRNHNRVSFATPPHRIF